MGYVRNEDLVREIKTMQETITDLVNRMDQLMDRRITTASEDITSTQVALTEFYETMGV